MEIIRYKSFTQFFKENIKSGDIFTQGNEIIKINKEDNKWIVETIYTSGRKRITKVSEIKMIQLIQQRIYCVDFDLILNNKYKIYPQY